MLFERIEAEGLAHFSYIIGSDGEACVIDPRRDCAVYLEIAANRGYRISTILETHRNEDYVVGSSALAGRTGARVWHADADLDYEYGEPARDGQVWRVGRLQIRALDSPGHTWGSMSYVVLEASSTPWILFSGDALFAGDVGRVDFLGVDRLDEMAGLLYETIFSKLLPLGEGVILCPAHGAGSVCGSAISSRNWTTIGLERRLNRKLQLGDRFSFVAEVGVALHKAPYFSRMEAVNLAAGTPACEPPAPASLSAAEFSDRVRGAVVVDTRCPSCFGAAHVPGAICIPEEEIPSYAGWFLPYDQPLLLVTGGGDGHQAARYLFRMGYDRLDGVLRGCIKAWHSAGLASNHAGIVDPVAFSRLLKNATPWVLDVRSAGELVAMPPVHGAHHIPIYQILERINDVPRDRAVYVMCATGTRATIVASLLLRAGVPDATIVLGGMVGLARAEARARGG